MKLSKILVTALVALATAVSAGIPTQDLSCGSIGFEYNGVLRGVQITEQDIMSHQRVQLFWLRYAPVEYVLISAGGGASRLSVDTYLNRSFDGGYGFMPAFALAAFTPRFIHKVLSVTAGGELSAFRSADKSGYSYHGTTLTPWIGLKISPVSVLDLEAGARWNLIYGTMEGSSAGALDFSNGQALRAYGSVTLHAPVEGAYLSIDFDASPLFSTQWTNGPAEASIGLNIGMILRSDRGPDDQNKNDTYFPAYNELKKKQRKMAGELESK